MQRDKKSPAILKNKDTGKLTVLTSRFCLVTEINRAHTGTKTDKWNKLIMSKKNHLCEARSMTKVHC